MKPNYFLSSLESTSFAITRECYVVRRLIFKTGKECVLARVNPVVIGQPFGLGGLDIEQLVFMCRHKGGTLFPIREFPCFVYITRLLFDIPSDLDVIDTKDVEIIAWGEIYKTRHDAENHIFPEKGGLTTGATP